MMVIEVPEVFRKGLNPGSVIRTAAVWTLSPHLEYMCIFVVCVMSRVRMPIC